MKRTNQTMLLILLLLAMVTPGAIAQNDLAIYKAFKQYGNKKGAVMVELSGDNLKGAMGADFEFKLFKSLTITDNPEAASFIRECIAEDEVGARKIKQVVASGVPTSVFLQLPPKNKMHRLILFNENTKPKQRVTLIYIESKSDSEEILNVILQRK